MSVLFPKGGMAYLISAFFDESGADKGSDLMCVAGYAYSDEQLVKANEEWSELLAAFGVRYFRMSEVAHGTEECRGLSREQRIDLETRAIGIIKRRSEKGMSVAVSKSKREYCAWRLQGPNGPSPYSPSYG
jgi:hypothetical protein